MGLAQLDDAALSIVLCHLALDDLGRVALVASWLRSACLNNQLYLRHLGSLGLRVQASLRPLT